MIPHQCLYTVIAQLLRAYKSCHESPDHHRQILAYRHRERLEAICREYLPSGRGFNDGTWIDFDRSTVNRIVFETTYHHMEEGVYTDVSRHDVIIKPDLAFGFRVLVHGKDINGIKTYIRSVFCESYGAPVSPSIEEVAK